MCVPSLHKFSPGNLVLSPQTEKYIEALQNKSLPAVDLLVREALQNSLDAAVNTSDGYQEVWVQWHLHSFDKDDFFKLFFNPENQNDYNAIKNWSKNNPNLASDRCLALKEFGTTGLTGEISDTTSSLYKLLYGFYNGKNANDTNAGGSFGAGKTVFIKPGIGFVCYYSRTTEGNELFEIFYCHKPDFDIFSPIDIPSGFSWWGGEKSQLNDSILMKPLDDTDEIHEILNLFHIKPYSEKETGTTIIIPFLQEDELRNEIKDISGQDEPDLRQYIEKSIMKWYAPRYRGDLYNHSISTGLPYVPYKYGKGLSCTFVDNPEDDNDSNLNDNTYDFKFFSIIREMYDYAVQTDGVPEQSPYIKFDVNYENKNTKVGTFIYRRLSFNDPELNALCTVWKQLDTGNTENTVTYRVLYCRAPGMLITYGDTDWSNGIFSDVTCNENEIILGLFVVATDNKCKIADNTYACDELFRGIERVDHYSWSPESSFKPKNSFNSKHIAKTVIKNIREKIKELENIQESSSESSNEATKFSNIFSSFITPKGDGNVGNNKQQKVRINKSQKSAPKPSVAITFDEHCTYTKNSEIEPLEVTQPFQIEISNNKEIQTLQIQLELAVTSGKYVSKTTATGNDGADFPFVLKDVKIKDILPKSKIEIEIEIDNTNEKCQLKIPEYNGNIKVKGEIVYTSGRQDVSCYLNVFQERR